MDLDNREIGQVYYNQYTSGSVLQQATRDINDYFPSMNFNANWVFVATWYEVAYYPNSGTVSQVNPVSVNTMSCLSEIQLNIKRLMQKQVS